VTFDLELVLLDVADCVRDTSCRDCSCNLALVMFKARGNCEQAQLSSQLSVVGLSLLVDRFKMHNFVLHFLELLS